MSYPRQDSNLNKESQNLLAPDCNVFSRQQLTPNAADGCSAGCSDQHGEGGITDPELARVAAAWPTLPEPIRRAMLALIGASAERGVNTPSTMLRTAPFGAWFKRAGVHLVVVFSLYLCG
ncbi:MAG TPA: hypothetical protein VN641_17610 [Urbifossiella sp.]|jgi:hypothetical protein|nr:hypothetical protein [Urbifossiella sp.]